MRIGRNVNRMPRHLSCMIILIGFLGQGGEYGGIDSKTDISGYAALVAELEERKRLQFLFPNPQSLFDGLHIGFVATSTGHLTFERRDLVLLNAGPLVISRVYDSRMMSDNGMGVGWKLNVQQTIRQIDDDLIYHEPSGNVLRFKQGLSGRYMPSQPTPRTDGMSLLVTGNTAIVQSTDKSEKVFARTTNGGVFRLASMVDENGHIVKLKYEDGKLVSLSVNEKIRVSIAWRDDAIVQLAGQHGRHVSYDYDGLGRLVAVEDIAGQKWTYDYGNDHKLNRAIYPNGDTYLEVNYDDEARVSSVDSSRNHSYMYSSNGRTTVKTGNSDIKDYTYNEKGVTTALIENGKLLWQMNLDAQNRPIKLVRNDEKYEFGYTANSIRGRLPKPLFLTRS